MRPSSRLELALVPRAADAPVEVGERLRDGWLTEGVLGPDGGPGPRADDLVAGGFRGWRLDRPDRLTLYANRQGGFGVRCPVHDAPIVPAFVAAWSRSRERDEVPVVPCPACGETHPGAALRFRPDAAFGRWALQLWGVETAALAPGAAARWPGLAAMVTVPRRG